MAPTRRARRTRRGLTLLELTVTLAVLALAAGLLLPRLGPLAAWRVELAARRLADGLTLARERAILRGAAVRVELDLDHGRWRIGDEAPRRLPADVRLRRVRLGNARVTAGALTLTFDPAGDALPARLDLDDGRARTVSVVLPPAGARARVVHGDRS